MLMTIKIATGPEGEALSAPPDPPTADKLGLDFTFGACCYMTDKLGELTVLSTTPWKMQMSKFRGRCKRNAW